jgi:hypothetical protein
MFRPYNGLVHEVHRTMRANGDRRDEAFVERLVLETGARLLVAQNGNSSNTVTHTMLESVHYFLSHRVLYVSNVLAEELDETRVEIPPDELRLPYHLFEVCFSDTLLIKGRRIPSALVLIKPDDSTFNVMADRFQRISNIAIDAANEVLGKVGRPPHPYRKTEVATKLKQSFYLLFRLDGQLDTCQLHFSMEEYKGVKTDDAIEQLLSRGPIEGFDALTPDEVEIERTLCRIIFGALCYLNVKDPEVEVGWKDRNRPRMGVKPAGVMLGRTMHVSPNRHMRKGSMHTLVHPRYVNVQYAWHRPCEVNPKAKSGGQREKSEELRG